MNKKRVCLFLAGAGMASLIEAAPLSIDLTAEAPPPVACPYGPGTTKNPQGQEITADQRSFFLDGQPWIPIAGEFHYARYPQAEWRDELLKMKAAGIDTVSTYVFWIYHEEEQGKWDWNGQRSLRDFIKLAQETGLKVIVRMGPWCHGEVRNGGFPDWVQESGTKLRTKDPAFLKLVESLFQEEAKQMRGLLWKDGGPVIGVQLDNECDRADYLLALKDMARAAGVDVPFYTITGWQGGLPGSELIPLFGGYPDGFWGGSHEDYRKEFLFNQVRAMNDLGAQLTNKNPINADLIGRFPYACAEIGGGMMSGYNRRIKIQPADVAALALAKLGSGNNMPGYYLFQGGVNPDGKLSPLNEDHPNELPVKDYDFQAPLGAAGQVREHYFLLREQHFFLQDFGPRLARMPAYFPEKRPAGLKDLETLRWDVRSDGQSGFLFFSNEQPYEPLPEHRGVQFAVKTTSGTVLIPRQPMTIPAGSYGILPVNLDCDGITLEYATAQPLCRIADGTATFFFFAALDGIAPELAIRAGDGAPARVQPVHAGTTPALSLRNSAGGTVVFVVLTSDQARQLSRLQFAGQQHAILSRAAAIPDGGVLRLETDSIADFDIEMFPRIPGIRVGDATLASRQDGIFSRFTFGQFKAPLPLTVAVSLEQPAGREAASLKGMNQAAWDDAAVYKLDIPADAANGRRLILEIDYIGDAARLYVGDRLFDDNFFNGDPFPIPLWRIPASDWQNIRLEVLPYSEGLNDRLPAEGKDKVRRAKRNSALDRITVTALDRLSLQVAPTASVLSR